MLAHLNPLRNNTNPPSPIGMDSNRNRLAYFSAPNDLEDKIKLLSKLKELAYCLNDKSSIVVFLKNPKFDIPHPSDNPDFNKIKNMLQHYSSILENQSNLTVIREQYTTWLDCHRPKYKNITVRKFSSVNIQGSGEVEVYYSKLGSPSTNNNCKAG